MILVKEWVSLHVMLSLILEGCHHLLRGSGFAWGLKKIGSKFIRLNNEITCDSIWLKKKIWNSIHFFFYNMTYKHIWWYSILCDFLFYWSMCNFNLDMNTWVVRYYVSHYGIIWMIANELSEYSLCYNNKNIFIFQL